MSCARLSPFDASFLAVETPTAHMHVGWVAALAGPPDGRRPGFGAIREHIARRLARAPRYRQRLAPVPLGVTAPEWVDDAGFAVENHVREAPAMALGELVDQVMSAPLRRDRPLWELWIRHDVDSGEIHIIGKAHHCMVDGLAALELTSLLLDTSPSEPCYEPDAWRAGPQPGRVGLLARGLRDRGAEQLALLRWPVWAAAAPSRAVSATLGGVPRVAGALRSALAPAPASPLNAPLTPLRSLVWLERPLDDLRTIKRRYRTTVNDVLLASVAGGLRDYLERHGQPPAPLKAMIPVNVRDPEEVLGNRISFVFAALPCDQPDPVRRLQCIAATMTARKHRQEPEAADLALSAAGHTPTLVQRAISRAVASPRTFNLVVSNIPGPSAPLYMLGCRLHSVYPVVPLADQHALSIGMMSVAGRACFGVYTDRALVPDAGRLAGDIDRSIAQLLVRARRPAVSRARTSGPRRGRRAPAGPDPAMGRRRAAHAARGSGGDE